MAFTKLTNADFNDKGALAMPNRPSETMSAQAIKTQFDAPSREVVMPAYNRLIDELEDPSGAASIGMVAPTGVSGNTVQAVMGSVVSELAEVESEISEAIADAHTHDNKTVLDKFSESSGEVYYNGSPIGSNDYEDLSNLPKVNNVTLVGNKSLSDLGVPSALADLSSDTTHRTVTDAEKSAWDNKSSVSVTQVVSSGTKIATINVDGTDTDIYATGGGGGSVDDAYKTVKVGQTTITASGEDTLELVAGANITLTPDSENKAVTLSAAGGVGVHEELIIDTVGWTGKNLLNPTEAQTGTKNGIIFEVNPDNSITFSGTATDTVVYDLQGNAEDHIRSESLYNLPTGRYIYSGCTDGSPETYSLFIRYSLPSGERQDAVYTEEIEINSEVHLLNTYIIVHNGAHISTPVTLYPMLRKKSSESSNYEPYHLSVEDAKFDRIAERSVGVKNLLAIPDAKNKTINGVTFTVNSDNSITFSGTATDTVTYDLQGDRLNEIAGESLYNLPPGRYIYSGCTDGAEGKYALFIRYRIPYGNTQSAVYTEEIEINSRLNILNAYIIVYNGASISTPVTVYPMLRFSPDSDDTYVPHFMTNEELTKSHDLWTEAATVDANGQVSFSGLDDTKGWAYRPHIYVTSSSTNMNPSAEITTLTGTGTSSMSVTYTTDADIGASVKLRIIK